MADWCWKDVRRDVGGIRQGGADLFDRQLIFADHGLGAPIRKWYQKLFRTGVSHFKMESRTVLYEGPVGYERGAYSVRVPGSGRNGEAARPPNGTKGESARVGGTCQIRRRELTRAAIV